METPTFKIAFLALSANTLLTNANLIPDFPANMQCIQDSYKYTNSCSEIYSIHSIQTEHTVCPYQVKLLKIHSYTQTHNHILGPFVHYLN